MNTPAGARWFAAAVIAGVVAVILAAVILLGIGVVDPSPRSLVDTPNSAIPGELLYVDEDACIVLARASGESRRQVHCLAIPPFRLYFLDTARLAYVSPTVTSSLVTVDLESGAELDSLPFDPSRVGPTLAAPDGTEAVPRDGGRIDLILDGRISGSITFDGLDWPPQIVGWSPDSQWLAMLYVPRHSDAAELWLISRDGRVRGTLATDASPSSPVAWRIDGGGTWPTPPAD